MPALENPSHERFAQEVAAGKTVDEAFVLAGYKRNRGNASRLNAKENITARVREILDAACQAVVLDRSWLVQELLKIAQAGLDDKHVKVGEKRRALVDLARIEGWMIDRTEHSGSLNITHEEALDQLK